VLLLLLLPGCRGKREATTGREFLERISTALREPDPSGFWKLMSEDTRRFMIEIVQQRVEVAKIKEQERTALTEDAGGELASQDPEKLAARVFHSKMARSRYEFVDEREEGGQVVVRYRGVAKGVQEWILVREEGGLRLNLRASMKREYRP